MLVLSVPSGPAFVSAANKLHMDADTRLTGSMSVVDISDNGKIISNYNFYSGHNNYRYEIPNSVKLHELRFDFKYIKRKFRRHSIAVLNYMS